MTVGSVTMFLESAFDTLNKTYFENALPKATITVQSSPKAYGHFTTWEAWQNNGKRSYEINLGAETLNRPVAATIGTLIHEMVHMYCKVNGIQDTSRGGSYHNKRFKEEAEKRGLVISYDKRIGWSITEPSKELKSFVAAQHWNGKIKMNRSYGFGEDGKGTTRKPSSTRKYICPCCGNSVRATKDVNILCYDCSDTENDVIVMYEKETA